MILLLSCNPDTNREISKGEIHLRIDPGNLPKNAKLSDLVESVRLIPLETSSDCIIGSTEKIFVGKNSIIVSVAAGNISELIHFSPDGSFLNKIGQQGKGPGEFTAVSDYTVFEDSSMVFIGMQRANKILAYSIDGSLDREMKFDKVLTNAKVLGTDNMAYRDWDFEVKIVNNRSQDTLKYIKTSIQTGSRAPFLSGQPHTGYFYSALGRDTIWRIESDSMRPKIVCDFGSGHYTSQEYIDWIVSGAGIPTGKLAIVGPSFYGSGYYYFPLNRENEEKVYQHYNIVVNEITQESWHLVNGKASDDVLFCTSTDFRTVAHTGEWVSVVGAYELIDAFPQIRDNPDFNYSPDIIKQIQKMKEDDNPVLVLYEFKK